MYWEFRASISLSGVVGFNLVSCEFRTSISFSGVADFNFVCWEFRASISLCGVAGFNFVCREFRASSSCSGVVRSCIVIARGCGAEALNWACVCGARSPERKSACWSARRLTCVCAGRERCPFHSRATWLAVAATARTKIMKKFCRKAVRNP